MKKCIFAYNPNSGKGKVKKHEKMIMDMLKEKYDVSLVLSEYPGHIYDVILKEGENIDLLVVAGGDGTLNEAVNGVCHLQKKPAIGYIPAGTVNDVAHSLNIPRNIKKAVRNILNGDEFLHDAIKVNDRYGIYVCCAGLFTETSYATEQKHKRRVGKLAYAFHGIKKVFTTPAFSVKLTSEGKNLTEKCSMIMLLNSRYVAGFPVNKRASLNDGLVDVILIKNKRDRVSGMGLFGVLKLFLFGVRKKSDRNYSHLLLNEFDLETTEDTVINLDGEKVCKGSFHCKMIKEAVKIIVPKKFLKKWGNNN